MRGAILHPPLEGGCSGDEVIITPNSAKEKHSVPVPEDPEAEDQPQDLQPWRSKTLNRAVAELQLSLCPESIHPTAPQKIPLETPFPAAPRGIASPGFSQSVLLLC